MTDNLNEPGWRKLLGSSNSQSEEERRVARKRIVLLVIGVVVVLFAILNFGRVKVNWIVTSGHTPLIIVIAVSFGFGIAADRLAIERTKRRRRGES